ncbi:MAG TPA: class I SAM-dependent methyltransferase, partial [Anaerolineae bacterium]|nr:class I SAM-dependent methyltransferase [Anaerolineae bacterium]
MSIDTQLTALTRARYNRLAPIYDWLETFVEALSFRCWRERLWGQVKGQKILEVGVGTGKNMPYYPPQAQVTAVDLSDRMVDRARHKAQRLGLDVEVREMDAQRLDFLDDSFDAAVATFVFCSVPDPVLGLRELARVVRPGGQIILLEHTRAENPLLGRLMDWLNPFVVRIMGANINRRTVDNVQRAGL